MSLSHMNDIRPPKQEMDSMITELLSRMPRAELQRLMPSM